MKPPSHIILKSCKTQLAWWFMKCDSTNITRPWKYTNLRNVSTGFSRFGLLNRWWEFTGKGLNRSGWLVLECQYTSSVHVECFCKLLPICLSGGRVNSWIFLTFLCLCQHVMCIVHIHRWSIRNEPIQLQQPKSAFN